jgi:hypothetical protein
VPAVLFFVLAGVAPLTVAAGVIPTAYAATGLTGIPAAFIVVILAVFATAYVTMARHITNAGAFYAFIARGLGRIPGVAPALAAVLLAGIVVLAVLHYGTLLGVAPGSPAAWMLPASYAVVAAIGLCWGAVLRIRRPQVYATIGLGAHATSGQAVPVEYGRIS